MRSHEQIYDILYDQKDRWFTVQDMVDESGLSDTTVRRAFHHLEASAMVERRRLAGLPTQYTLLFIPLPVTKRKWFRRKSRG